MCHFFHFPAHSSAISSDSFRRCRNFSPQCFPHTPQQHPLCNILSDTGLLYFTDTACCPVCDSKRCNPDCGIHRPGDSLRPCYNPVQLIVQKPQSCCRNDKNYLKRLLKSLTAANPQCLTLCKNPRCHTYHCHAGKHHIPCIIRCFIPEPVPLVQILFNSVFLHSIDICTVLRRLQFAAGGILNRLTPVIYNLSESNTLRCLFTTLYDFYIQVSVFIISQYHTKCIFFETVICQTLSGIRCASSQDCP